MERKEKNLSSLLNQAIYTLFLNALKISLTRPHFALFILKTLYRQQKAARLRKRWAKKGLHVPPFFIISITHQCNMGCKGCYLKAQNRLQGPELEKNKARELLEEAKELGVSLALLAGGEPLMRRDILALTKDFPQIIFAVFTNGLLIKESDIKNFKRQKNLICVLSIEGFAYNTNQRRGVGVYQHLEKIMAEFKRQGIFYGVSVTLTRENFSVVTQDEFIQKLLSSGCQLFFFVEYVPVEENTEDLTLTQEQQGSISCLMDVLSKKHKALFIAFPGDEAKFGGCLAAGRGFIHISAKGEVEPCPFAPYSLNDISTTSLKEALQSGFLTEIRENYQQLSESVGGCALWEKREWVEQLLKRHSGN